MTLDFKDIRCRISDLRKEEVDTEMERTTTTPQPEDVPVELIQRIQSLLPFKEDARSCILSKSWLHAWSTIPTLKFLCPDPGKDYSTYEKETKYQKLIHRALQRYHRDNIPIESFHLQLNIIKENHDEIASLAKSWIQKVVSKSCLKDLSLKIGVFTNKQLTIFPNELFSSQNLNAINVTKTHNLQRYPLRICTNPEINCVSLRVLELQDVIITEHVLHNLLSTCSLLEKIKLLCCKGFMNVKVKNLLRLHELDISTEECPGIINLEINNVPSLRSFCYLSLLRGWLEPIPFQMDSLTSLTQLHIDGVIINDLFFDIVKSKFPLLESLTLGFGNWGPENMVITSVSLRWLTLKVLATSISAGGPVNIQVNAPRLLSFKYDGILIPDLSFPTIAPEQIKLTLKLTEPMDHSYFLEMRKALNLSSKFDIKIIHDHWDEPVPWDIDVDDLRRRVSVSVTDVQLSLELAYVHTEPSRFFDAFFSICHPSYIKCEKKFSRNAFYSIRKKMEGKTNDLKDVMVKNPRNEKWEALKCSWEGVFKTLTGHDYFECRLNWFPQ